jgi:hypothetical protein
VKNPIIDRCIVNAILRWEFPRPIGGGWVLVEYPFRLVAGPGYETRPSRGAD